MKTIKAHPKANLRGYGKYVTKARGRLSSRSFRTLANAKKAVREHKKKYPKTRRIKVTYLKVTGKSKYPLKYHGKWGSTKKQRRK